MKLKSNIYIKVGMIIVLILILLIPTTMVESLIYEREHVQRNAISEVSSKWGNGQTLTGPYISIPYDKYIRQYSEKDTTHKLVKVKKWIYFLPEELKINGSISPEKRYRGIYEVVVYESNLKLEGVFQEFDFARHEIDVTNVHFDKASINIGITDLKGIEQQIGLQWNGRNFPFNSGATTNDIIQSGINASVPIDLKDSSNYKFSLTMDLKGSQNLYFTPLGKTTDVALNSNWNTPSFTGNYLPDDRSVSEDGFNASWNILHLNRNYPQSWIGNQHQVHNSSFGTDLLLPVDNYKKSHRVARYAILFLALTFLVFFFVEIMNNVYIHPIQYLLVGMAIVVFYTLLLSFSEHIRFNFAYIYASLLTLGLITAYTIAILKSKKIGLMLFSILAIMYTFIFTIIQMEDYALLIGSIGVFVILSMAMYFSRKIDWYNISIGPDQQTQ